MQEKKTLCRKQENRRIIQFLIERREMKFRRKISSSPMLDRGKLKPPIKKQSGAFHIGSFVRIDPKIYPEKTKQIRE